MTPEMTVQEAITRINLLIGSEKLFIKISTMGEISHSQNIEALEMAKRALELKSQFDEMGLTIEDIKVMNEKRTPKKPLYRHICPTCEGAVRTRSDDPYNKICQHCGQALDWGNKNDT